MNAEVKKMPAHPAQLQDPVFIARLALRKLAELALAPTPENYARAFKRAAGLRDDEPHSEGLVSESADMLLGIFETIGQTTTGLSVGIERFDGDLNSMFNEADQLSADGVRGLLEGLAASRLELQKTVTTSRLELDATRQRLDQVSAELERSRKLARIDPLTGLVNRRGMDEIVVREIARARRAKAPLSVAMLDIDHFKRVNDAHGHDVGDLALVHLAAVARSVLRDTDVICRYGGEEFVVILPDSGIQGALFVVDRLRMMVEKTPLPIPSGKLQIRFSAGIAELSGEEDRDALLKRADAALFAAKRAGRNQVAVAPAASVA